MSFHKILNVLKCRAKTMAQSLVQKPEYLLKLIPKKMINICLIPAKKGKELRTCAGTMLEICQLISDLRRGRIYFNEDIFEEIKK